MLQVKMPTIRQRYTRNLLLVALTLIALFILSSEYTRLNAASIHLDLFLAMLKNLHIFYNVRFSQDIQSQSPSR